MTFQNWVNQVKKGVDYDGRYGKQCVDIVNDFAHEVLGIRGAFYGVKYAYQMYTQFGNFSKMYKNFEKIDVNKRGDYPRKGDVIVWTKAKNGYAGHTAVALYGDKTGFYCIEQNFDGKGSVRIHKYNYSWVAGWLRPKNQVKVRDEYNEYNDLITLNCDIFADNNSKLKIGTLYQGDFVKVYERGRVNTALKYPVTGGYKVGIVKTKYIS